jgi:uncharacterized membrane protein
MIATKTEQVIERPAAEVWTYAAEIIHHPEWMSVRDATVLRGTGSEVGARGREGLALGPIHWNVEFEVAEAVAGRRIVWRSVSGAPFDLEVNLDLEPVGDSSTRATYGTTIQPHGIWRLLSPLMAAEGKTGPERELLRLKENLEKGAASTAATA